MVMKEIGGYFQLELNKDTYNFPHQSGCLVNTGRNALELICIQLDSIKHIWIPLFSCDSILEPIIKLNIPYTYYSINEQLELQSLIKLGINDYILYTNYFGIKDKYIQILYQNYSENLIIDNAQALYSRPISNICTLYSPRKFVGVPDGGIAVLKEKIDITQYKVDVSYKRFSHLLERHDVSASKGYKAFKKNELSLNGQPIRQMSNLTKKLLSKIDFDAIKNQRIANFTLLQHNLSNSNLLKIDLEFGTCPMVYPYYIKNNTIRQDLINNKIYAATYWPNVFLSAKKESTEYDLAQHILPLPIDQRYKKEDMNQIIKILQKYE